MGKFVDLAGKQFGRLTVVDRAPNDPQNQTTWECKCQCGNVTMVRSSALRNEITQSCGCLQAEMSAAKNLRDITGKKFGRLTVIERAPNDGQTTRWKCQCQCGGTCIVRKPCLTQGTTKSCGCLNKENVLNKSLNLIGRKYGNLTVVSILNLNELGNSQCLCKCECGNTRIVDVGNLRTAKSCKICSKKSFSDAMRDDLTGRRFGKLTVVERAENAKDGKPKWKCTCDCGNSVVVRAASLVSKRGGTKSCKCLVKENSGGSPKDITGMRSGMLIAVKPTGSSWGSWSLWECRCDCGKTKIAPIVYITRGMVISCGCMKKNRGSPLLSDTRRSENRIISHNRRARISGNGGTFRITDWNELVSRSPHCYWCKRPWTKKRRPTHDHVIPISRGGKNSPENSVCSCINCNSQKNAGSFNPSTGQGILL